jgi:hypothetical protein
MEEMTTVLSLRLRLGPLSHADQNECFQQNVIQRQINSDYRSHKDS